MATLPTGPGLSVPTQQSKKAEGSYLTSPDGPPLDFSFKNIKDLSELKMMDPRPGGKRKPIPQEEEENKDEKQKDDEKDQNKNGEEQEAKQDKDDEQEQKEGEDPENKTNKQKKEEKKEEKKQPEVIRAIPNQTAFIMQSTAVSAAAGTAKVTIAGGTLPADLQGKTNQQVKRVKLICTSLILSYNKIRSLKGFHQVIDQVMYDCRNLAWIDLSHNFLTSLDYDFSEFPQLKSLYLHCNYLPNLRELEKLEKLPLRSLTIHGNPVETIPNFRLYIIALLPNLKRLDSVLISKKERDNASVWINQFRHTKIPEVKNPPLPVDDTAQASQNQTGKQDK